MRGSNLFWNNKLFVPPKINETKNKMKILIACEESQAVCKEFRKLGHEAFSCDILPCNIHMENHIINGKKKCGTCGEIKTIDNFYKYKDYYRSYCKQCNSNNTKIFRSIPKNKDKLSGYGKNHYNKLGNKKKKQEETKKYLINIKEKCVIYKGGKCEICGYNKCINALEFHHKNPLTKDSKLNSRGINRRQSFEKNKVELDKCILVCANCHRELHYE